MKLTLGRGVLCSCLLFLAQAPYGEAQEVAQQQQPPAPQPPAPPQPAPPQPPALQQQPQAPAPPQSTQEPSAPAPATAPVEHDTGGDVYSVEPFYWLTKSPPVMGLGRASKGYFSNVTGTFVPGQTVPGNLNFPGGSRGATGVLVTIPTGHENSLQFTYFRILGDGDTFASQDLLFFGNPFTQGDQLITNYKIQNFKLSWNYLTYPFPSSGAKLRIKTLWEIQYTKVFSSIDAPADVYALTTQATKSIVFPTFGLGIEYHKSEHLYFEAKGSGFGVPFRADIWDIEGSFVYRIGRVEIFGGGKGYHFKTSPQDDQYFTDTLWGPYAGVRWIFR